MKYTAEKVRALAGDYLDASIVAEMLNYYADLLERMPREPTEAMTLAYLEAQKATVMASDKAWGVADPKKAFAAGFRAMLSVASSPGESK